MTNSSRSVIKHDNYSEKIRNASGMSYLLLLRGEKMFFNLHLTTSGGSSSGTDSRIIISYLSSFSSLSSSTVGTVVVGKLRDYKLHDHKYTVYDQESNCYLNHRLIDLHSLTLSSLRVHYLNQLLSLPGIVAH